MSFESAFYNKYANLTNNSARELLQALLILHNHTKRVSYLFSKLEQNEFSETDISYAEICLIQENFLKNREFLCQANEMICSVIRERKQHIDVAYDSNCSLPGIKPNTLNYIKKKQYHYKHITDEHKHILDKQDLRLTNTIEQLKQLKSFFRQN